MLLMNVDTQIVGVLKKSQPQKSSQQFEHEGSNKNGNVMTSNTALCMVVDYTQYGL